MRMLLRLRVPRVEAGSLTAAILCVAAFGMRLVAGHVEFVRGYSFSQLMLYAFGVHWPLLASGFFWQPVTYIFLHHSWIHLLANLVLLLSFGSDVERAAGRGRFWLALLATGALAGLGWVAANAVEPAVAAWLLRQQHPVAAAVAEYLMRSHGPDRYGICIGASGAVYGLVGVCFAMLRRPHMTLILGLLAVVALVEPILLAGQVAYVAHLVGLAAGVLLGRHWRRVR